MKDARVASSTPAPAGRDLAFWMFGVFLLALAVRAVVYLELTGEFVFDLPVGDSRGYMLWARSIAQGDLVGDAGFFQSPLYPYFVALVDWFAGESLQMLRAAQSVLGGLACALLLQAGWHLLSKPAGIVAGLALALHPAIVFSDLMLEPTVLEVLWVCVIVTFMVDLGVRDRARAAIGLGVALGALVLTRESAIVFLVVLVPWLLSLPGWTTGRRRRAAALMTVGLLALLIPAAVIDASASGQLRLTGSHAAYHFYVGNRPDSDGTYLPPVQPDLAEATAYRQLGEDPGRLEVTGFYLGQALSGIGSDPVGWLGLMGRKLLLVTNRIEPTDTEEYLVYADFSRLLAATSVVLNFGVLLPLAFFGVWITWSERRRLWPYYGLVAVQLGSAVLFYVSGRHRLTVLPVVLLLASAGLTGIPQFFRSRGGSAIASGLAATAAVAVLVCGPWFDWRAVRSMTYYNLGNALAELGARERAALRYETALELDPDNAPARNNYGVLLAQFKMPGAAAREFRQALRVVPDYADAHFNLARVLRDAFDDAGAIEHYRAGLEIDPAHPEVYVELGRTQLDVGDRAGARESFLRALRMDPQNEGAAAGLQALRRSQEPDRAATATP